MADAGVTMTGLKDMRAAVQQLPKAVTERLRAVAWRKARDVRAGAMDRLRAKTHGTGKTASSIVVIEETEHKRFVVAVRGDPSHPANLPLWLEKGTVTMTARPYMLPALEAVSDSYVKESEAAAVDAAREALT